MQVSERLDPLELELEAAVSHPIWVLRIKFGSLQDQYVLLAAELSL